MENRVKKRVRFFLFVFLVKAMFLAFFPCTASAEAQKDSSWTSYFSRYLVFWETDDGKKSEKEVADQKAWKKIAVDFNDFLPDNLPGVAEYRRAARYQLWENQPSHTEQEVYDLYGVSARKGRVSLTRPSSTRMATRKSLSLNISPLTTTCLSGW